MGAAPSTPRLGEAGSASPSTPRLGEAGSASPGTAEQMFAALVGDKAYPISSDFWRQLLELPLTQQWPRDRVLQACHPLVNYLVSASAQGATSQLVDSSLLVLLILIHYQKCISMNECILTDGVYMNTNVKDAPAFHENPYCKALNNAKDIQFEGNAQNGPVVRLSFAPLFDALGTCLKDESSVLLLYSLVHGNCDFQEYVLVRTDLDTLFNSRNSFLSSQVGLGLAVQGSDAWHSKCEKHGFAEGVSTEAAATSDANANTNEEVWSSKSLSSSKAEGTQLSSVTDVSPRQQKTLVIHKDFRFVGCFLLIIISMFLPSSEAREIVRLSDSEFCSDHHLLAIRISMACIPTQPEPICCELLVPALDTKGCICKLINDGTELDNFLMKYTSCGGQYPELLEEAQTCSSAPIPAVTKVAPTQKIPEMATIVGKPKNVTSLRVLLVILLFVVLMGLVFWAILELKKRREARRVGPQAQEVQLGGRVTLHPRQTADVSIRNQHIDIPILEDVTLHPRQTADVSIRNQHVDIPILEDVPFLGPMTRNRFISVQGRGVGAKGSTGD